MPPVSVSIPITQQESEFIQNVLVRFRDTDPLINDTERALIISILGKLQAVQSSETPA